MNNSVSIQIDSVTKEYKGHVKGLDNVSLSIPFGVYGLLGHNGAGKTTLMKIIVTIMKPTLGHVYVFNHDTLDDGNAVRQMIGYVPQELGLYNDLSVVDFISYMAAIKGIRGKRNIENVIEYVGLSEQRRRKIGQLSGGMKRRVGIAQALVGNPQLLIVDEPTAGLDPEERIRFRGVLSRFAKDRKTVLLSTHIVEDVYQLCENLAVLRKGKLFFAGSSQELISKIKDKVKIVEISDESEIAALSKKAVILSTTYGEKSIHVRIVDENNSLNAAAVPETLEDAYVFCMGGKNA